MFVGTAYKDSLLNLKVAAARLPVMRFHNRRYQWRRTVASVLPAMPVLANETNRMLFMKAGIAPALLQEFWCHLLCCIRQ
jgi:hypothetical protein